MTFEKKYLLLLNYNKLILMHMFQVLIVVLLYEEASALCGGCLLEKNSDALCLESQVHKNHL